MPLTMEKLLRARQIFKEAEEAEEAEKKSNATWMLEPQEIKDMLIKVRSMGMSTAIAHHIKSQQDTDLPK